MTEAGEILTIGVDTANLDAVTRSFLKNVSRACETKSFKLGVGECEPSSVPSSLTAPATHFVHTPGGVPVLSANDVPPPVNHHQSEKSLTSCSSRPSPSNLVRRTRNKWRKSPVSLALCFGLSLGQTSASPLTDLVASTISKYGLVGVCDPEGIAASMESFGAGHLSAVPVLLANPSVSEALKNAIGNNAPAAFLPLLHAEYKSQFGSSPGVDAASGSATSGGPSTKRSTKMMSVSITKKGGTKIMAPSVVEIDPTETFKQCYEANKPPMFDDSSCELRCFLSRMDRSAGDGWPKKVDAGFVIAQTAESFGATEIIFEVSSGHKSAVTPVTSFFDRMKEAQRDEDNQRQVETGTPPLPKRASGPSANNKDLLRVEVQQFFTGFGLKTTKAMYEAVGSFLDEFTAMLWFINPHIEVLKTRAHLPHPALAQLYDVVWNDLAKKHQTKPRLDSKELAGHVGNLYNHLLRPWMSYQHHGSIKAIVDLTVRRLGNHVAYMEAKSRSLSIKYTDIVVLEGRVKLAKFDAVTKLPPMPPSMNRAYKLIAEAVIQAPRPYTVVPIDELLPAERRNRARLLLGLHIEHVPIVLYTYHLGGSHLDQHYVITLPTETTVTIEEIAMSQAIIKVHETVRQNAQRMQSVRAANAFRKRWSAVTELTPAVARGIFQDISGSFVYSKHAKCRDMDKRMMALVEGGDVDVVLDGRACNGRKGSKFDDFWDALGSHLDGQDLLAVDERRHGDVSGGDRPVTHLADDISMRSLHETVCEQCPDAAHPSLRWMEYQFWPKNTLFQSAVQYTGRFAVSMMVQSRQLRKDHDDIIVGHVEFKYLKEFCCKYRTLVDLVAEDDKHKVSVGEPGYPVAAAQKTRRVVVGKHKILAAADHDFTRCSLIPSVALIINVPEHSHESFYAGQAHVCIKNAITQPSSALRHTAETRRYYGPKPNPILVKYHDGGSDHKDTNGAVRVASIIEFLKDDRDYYLSMRCVPGQSFKDPAEHVMSVLNLCQQCAAFDRREMAPEEEQAIKNDNSMAAIRTTMQEEGHEGLRSAVELSLKPTIEVLGSLYKRAVFSGNHVQVHEAAEEAALDDLFSTLQDVAPDLGRTDTTRKALEGSSNFQMFVDEHVRFGLYKTCIMKCDDPNCPYHKPVRMPKEIWEQMDWFPDAMIDPKSETSGWRSFEDSWGESRNSHTRSIPCAPDPWNARPLVLSTDRSHS